MKKLNFIVTDIEFVDKDDDILEAYAALSTNPMLKWIKFVATDTKANSNKQRVPKEEFANIISTGINMPIKMAEGGIRDGHEFSVPIGSITGLIERGDVIKGIAALWYKEFPHEVDILEEMTKKGENPQLSWELLYADSDIDDNGVENLRGIVLSAVTVVNTPAYEGRTFIELVASKNSLEEKHTMEENIKDLEEKLEQSKATNDQLTSEISELKEALEKLTNDFNSLKEEKDSLAAFKEKIDLENARKEKLASVINLFEESGVTLPETYFEDEAKVEKLLDMDLNQLEFIIQELSKFGESDASDETNDAEASHLGSKNKIPKMKANSKDKPSISDIVKALKDREN